MVNQKHVGKLKYLNIAPRKTITIVEFLFAGMGKELFMGNVPLRSSFLLNTGNTFMKS